MCVCVYVRVCVCVCVRACVRACVCVPGEQIYLSISDNDERAEVFMNFVRAAKNTAPCLPSSF